MQLYIDKAMPENKATDHEIQEMFGEGNLIARALHTGSLNVRDNNLSYDFTEFKYEMQYLGSENMSGIHKNVERDGQRNRSATLLVPGVQMDLFAEIGILYNADKSTIRGYMFHDSITTSQSNHDNYYNINSDKSKFEPIISRKEFLDKYRDYRKETDNSEKEHVAFNEVLGNFFRIP